MTSSLKLYVAIVLAMIFWSFSFIWTKVAIVSFPPMTLITLRLTIASVLLFVLAKVRNNFRLIRKKDFLSFLLLAFFEPFLYYVGETYGLTMVESTLASVIVSTIPLFAPVMAFFILREKPGMMSWLGIIVSLVGVVCLIYRPGVGMNANPWGITLLFMAVLAAIAYSTTLKKIPDYYSTPDIIFYQSLFGLIFFIPTAVITDHHKFYLQSITASSLLALLMLSVFASVIAFVLFAWAVRKIGVTRTNVFVNLIPIFTALFSWLIFKDAISSLEWTGIAIVVAGLFISQVKR